MPELMGRRRQDYAIVREMYFHSYLKLFEHFKFEINGSNNILRRISLNLQHFDHPFHKVLSRLKIIISIRSLHSFFFSKNNYNLRSKKDQKYHKNYNKFLC